MSRGSIYIRATSLAARSGRAALLVVLFVMIPTVFTSYLLNEDRPHHHTSWNNVVLYLSSGNWLPYMLGVWACASISGLIVYLLLNNEHRQVIRVFSRDNDIPILRITLVSGVIVAIFVIGSHVDLDNARMHAGGLFDIVIGIISVAGIWLTLNEVLDIHNSIVSFQDLLNRIEDLIKATPGDEIIDMMVLTPAMGCMVLPDRNWHHLVNLIRDENHNISMTCLSNDNMKEWLGCYTLVSDSDEVKAEKSRRQANGLQSSARTLDILLDYHKDRNHQIPMTGSFSELSTTYMIANRNRAIVAVPLYMPTPQFRPEWKGHDKRRVQFIGFETKDVHIVESVQEEIRLRRQIIEKGIDAAASSSTFPSSLAISSSPEVSDPLTISASTACDQPEDVAP